MAVTYDNSTVAPSEFNVNTITTPAFTIAGTNLAAILFLAIGTPTITSITMSLGGVSGVAITGADSTTAQGIRLVCFRVLAPPTGSRTATASWTGLASVAELGVITARGVDQTTPVNGGNFNSGAFVANVSVVITSVSGDLTATAGYVISGGTTLVTNQTIRWNDGTSVAGDTGPGTTTPTHTWNRGANDTWVVAGANFKAAAAGGRTTKNTEIPRGVAKGLNRRFQRSPGARMYSIPTIVIPRIAAVENGKVRWAA